MDKFENQGMKKLRPIKKLVRSVNYKKGDGKQAKNSCR